MVFGLYGASAGFEARLAALAFRSDFSAPLKTFQKINVVEEIMRDEKPFSVVVAAKGRLRVDEIFETLAESGQITDLEGLVQ